MSKTELNYALLIRRGLSPEMAKRYAPLLGLRIKSLKLKSSRICHFVIIPKQVEEEVKLLSRTCGFIIRDKNNWKGAVHVTLRLDQETYKAIKQAQKFLPNFNFSEVLRVLILYGLDSFPTTHGKNIKLHLETILYEILMQRLMKFNKEENVNMSLTDFIALLLERALAFGLDKPRLYEPLENLPIEEGFPEPKSSRLSA
ncbi:MAG: hypothetical protein QXI39_00320 [Candidatus Bathyarchaeia archaeon]